MIRTGRHIAFRLLLLSVVPLFWGCSLIDEELSGCVKSQGMEYELQLVTNFSTELETKLRMSTEVALSAALRTYLAPVFTDHADDVDLSFYDVQGDSLRLHYEQHMMDASQSSYTLLIPVHRYMHLATVNVMGNQAARLLKDEKCHSAMLALEEADTVASQRTGLFTARLPMDVVEGKDQQFDVHLSMANCATSLVLDTHDVQARDIRVFVSGMAHSFSIADSIYHYRPGMVVRAERLEWTDDAQEWEQCFTAVGFPTRDVKAESKVIIETDDFVEPGTDTEPVWEIHVLVTLQDGSITRSVLQVYRSVKAGQYSIIKAYLRNDGATETQDVSVGVSVKLNWKPGGNFIIPV